MPTAHPLDPLTPAEISRVREAILGAPEHAALARGVRFITLEVRAPEKEALEARAEAVDRGDPVPEFERLADVVLLDRADATTHEVLVAVADATVVEWRHLEGVQPLAVVEELAEAEELVKSDPGFQEALAKRGVTDFEAVQVDAWPAGNFGAPEEQDRRLARCLAFLRPGPGDSEWAHPVDGLIVLVDLTTLEVLRIDDHGVVPIPEESGNFDVEAATADGRPLRDDIRPLEITQPEGPSFELDGRVLRWQNWELHVGFTPREGLVLNQVAYHDQGRRRPILFRASLSEMVVPYGDPSPTHFFKNAFDAGENGVGIAASPLTLGCDCLGEIRYLDAAVANGDGEPVEIPNAICIHEEDTGVLWRHIEWRNGEGEVRRGAAAGDLLVLGDRQLRLRLLLVPAAGRHDRLRGQAHRGAFDRRRAARRGAPRHGVLVAPGLNAMVHQHYFNLRLDLDVDGRDNSVVEVSTESTPPGPENPHGNAFEVRRKPLRTEGEARRRVDPASARWWEIVNPNHRHRLGAPVGYRLVPGENTRPFADLEAAVMKRAGFIGNHLWVTPYDRAERYAAGEYPNQHPGGAGLPEWTAADRPIVDRDLVIWYTFGHHHVPRAEDWPVMPVATIGFALKPVELLRPQPGAGRATAGPPPPTPTSRRRRLIA